MKKKVFALLVATIMVATTIMPAFAASMPFADVPKEHWAYDSVAELAAAGLVIGYPDGTFKGERQFTRYEMAMVFARILGRLDTLIAAEVGAEVKGLSDDIYDRVAQALVEEMAKVKAELTATIEDEVARIELPAPEVVERVVVEQPVEVVMPFELTDEAKAVIAKVAADAVAENVAKLEPKVVEKIVEAEPELTAKDLAGLLGAVANAQTTADLNAEEIAALKEDIAAARRLLDELAFTVEVNDAVLGVTKLKADMATDKADAAQKTADTATEQALAALKVAEDAGAAAAANKAAIDAANQEIRNLALTIAALEGDVNAVAALLESTTAALEKDIVALSEEFAAELESLGVRVADLEGIVADHGARIDLLEWEVRQLDEATAANAADIADLKAADEELAGDLAALETEHEFTRGLLRIVDQEQQATAADFAAFKAEHEKVKLSGSTETVFENIGIERGAGTDWPDDEGEWYVYRDPRDRDDDDSDKWYKPGSKLEQKFVLNLEAVPAEGVTLKAKLADSANILGDSKDDEPKLDLSNITLELETDKALRSLYVGERAEEDIVARYNEFIINQEPDDQEVVAANVVLGNLDTEIQLFRPWSEATDLDPEARYGALVNAAYKLSDAFIIDLQYARVTFDDTATTETITQEPDDWAYSIGLKGDLSFADYTVAFANENDEKSAYMIEVGKVYGPEPAEDEEDLRAQWEVTYKSVDDGYGTHLTDDDVDKYKSNLSLSADNFDLLGLKIGGGYVTKEGNHDANDDVTAMKLTAKKSDLFGMPLTVSGQYASIDHPSIKDDSSFLMKVAYEPTFGKLKLGASYEYTSNAIDDDYATPGDWVASMTEADGKAVAESTVALSAEYPVEIWDTTITGFIGYENRSSELEGKLGRDYQEPLMTYRVSAERDFGEANLFASYQLRTGGPEDKDSKYAKRDTIGEVKLTYPVIDDVADLVLGYRYVDVEAYSAEYDYTVNELNAGLKFEF